MQRVFFSPIKECNADCLYCFAKWANVYGKRQQLYADTVVGENSIVYPFCDGGACLNNDFFSIAAKILNVKNTCVSISVKQKIDDDTLVKISDLNTRNYKNNSFIKISVSISTKKSIPIIEYGTSQYEDRIILLKSIFDLSIPSSVMIKPVLPFIPFDEYRDIIEDTKFLGNYVVGDLYVNTSSSFFSQYIKDKFCIAYRPVRWLEKCPTWAFVEQKERMHRLQEFILANNLNFFNSDAEFVKMIIGKEQKI